MTASGFRCKRPRIVCRQGIALKVVSTRLDCRGIACFKCQIKTECEGRDRSKVAYRPGNRESSIDNQSKGRCC